MYLSTLFISLIYPIKLFQEAEKNNGRITVTVRNIATSFIWIATSRELKHLKYL